MATQKEMANQPLGNRLYSGYEGSNIPDDFEIPAVGLEDVDVAIYNLFDKDNPLYILSRDEDNTQQYQKKVPVVFATGERFALRERREPIRDKSGAIILPVVSIRRTSLSQAKENMGSAIGQDTGDFVIKKRLSSKDPQYQNIINKIGLKNQDNVSSANNLLNALDETGSQDGKVASRRAESGESDFTLNNKIERNIVEVITIPFPKRFVATYEVVFWTSFTTHMNQMIERVLSNYDGQGNTYKLSTNKGYYFVAYFDDEIQPQDNSEEFTNDERIKQYSFTVQVPGYMIANRNGGDMVPFRRYYSAPQISFEIYDGIFESLVREQGVAPTGKPNDFIFDKIANLDNRGREIKRLEDLYQRNIIKNPFDKGDENSFVRIKRRNARVGETVISAKKLFDVEIP